LHRALELHIQPVDWARIQRHAMQLRFGWHEAAQSYHALYSQLLARSGTGSA
jgi:glycogen synthase